MTEDLQNIPRIEIVREVYHHYVPLKGWLFQKGNYVMVQFVDADPERVEQVFQTPSGSKIDMSLVEHFKTMARGKAIILPIDKTISSRSLKVQVGKAAKLAGRKISWAGVDEGFMARVVAYLDKNGNEIASPDGAVTPPTPEPPSEPSGRNRNR